MKNVMTTKGFMELDQNEMEMVDGGDKTIYGGGVIFRFNVVYSDTAFNDACIWGTGGAITGGVTSGGIGAAVGGIGGFVTSTASSINNGNAHIDYGFNF